MVMFILTSIQEFEQRKIGFYKDYAEVPNRLTRKAVRLLLRRGTPQFAIFISSDRVEKGTFQIYYNLGSFHTKRNKLEGTEYIGYVTI